MDDLEQPVTATETVEPEVNQQVTEADDSEEMLDISFEDVENKEEIDEESAPGWVKDLRKSHRELKRKLREYEQKDATQQQATVIEELPPKPTPDSVDYDFDKFDEELVKWTALKTKHDEKNNEIKRQQEEQTRSWQKTLQGYAAKRKALSAKVSGFEDAEEVVQEHLNVQQQGIILHGLEDSAKLVYAIGSHPEKAKELARITDPVKFAIAVGELKTSLKVTSRSVPQPERVISGSGRVSGAKDATLERLRKESERTGDLSKVLAYKRKLKNK